MLVNSNLEVQVYVPVSTLLSIVMAQIEKDSLNLKVGVAVWMRDALISKYSMALRSSM